MTSKKELPFPPSTIGDDEWLPPPPRKTRKQLEDENAQLLVEKFFIDLSEPSEVEQQVERQVLQDNAARARRAKAMKPAALAREAAKPLVAAILTARPEEKPKRICAEVNKALKAAGHVELSRHVIGRLREDFIAPQNLFSCAD
jgi:hypothetical protein